MMTSLREAALSYAARGWPVLPLHTVSDGQCSCGKVHCPSSGKHPRTGHGMKEASKEVSQVSFWWGLRPTPNIGIATGVASGLWVLDIDPRNGGDESIRKLQSEGLELGETLIAITGGGGLHYYYKMNGEPVRCRANLWPGIDIKGNGGYVVAPGSIHPSGESYEWMNENPISDAPEWLLRAVTAEPVKPEPVKTESTEPTTTDPGACLSAILKIKTKDGGDGSKRLFAAACRCVEHGLSDADSLATIRGYEKVRPFPRDWTDAQIIKRLRDAEKKATRGSHNKPAGKPHDQSKPSQADQLVSLLEQSEMELFHTSGGHDSEAYASITVGGDVPRRETWPLHSRAFKRWVSRQFYLERGKAPAATALTDAMNVVGGKALHESPEYRTALRIAEHDGDIWLDLANEHWQAVRITSKGWRVVDSAQCPIRFIRRRGMGALPVPATGGRIDMLRGYLNLPDDSAWALYLGWLTMAFNPSGPYPILIVNGEQGSAKSTLCRLTRELIDPNKSPLRRPPRDDRDCMIGASNGWIVAFDNLSGLSGALSDLLCILATGGGFSTRELYSDDEEKIFEAKRPVMLNGIDDVASRADLLDRAVNLTLPVIPNDKRQREADLLPRFEAQKPRILGAMLDAVSVALRDVGKVKLAEQPRMADFAAWAVAAEPALGVEPGSFLEAYSDNREAAVQLSLESSPIGPAVISLMGGLNDWQGTASELLVELSTDCHSDDRTRRRKDWPATSRGMGAALRRLAPDLRRVGIEATIGGRSGHQKKRLIRIYIAGKQQAAQAAQAANAIIEPENGFGCGPLADDAAHCQSTTGRTQEAENQLFDPETRGAAHAAHATHCLQACNGDWSEV